MDQQQLNAALAASPSPDRVTPEYLASRIAKVEFHRLAGGTMTLCILTVDNGFQLTGTSACADPANYRQDVGEKIARDNAERQLWPLLGFALKDAMAARESLARGLPTFPVEGWHRCRSHKVVEAAMIHAAEFKADGSGKVAIRSTDGGPEIVEVPAGFLRKPGAVNEGDVIVRYADGYLSHSPLKAFIQGYTFAEAPAAPQDWRDRVRRERADLAGKLDKLRAFLGKGRPANVTAAEWDRLDAQWYGMSLYISALDDRIAAFA